jgi:hypothetical protein
MLLAESLATCSSESSLPPLVRAKSRALMDELPQLRARLMRACQPLLLLSKRAGAVPQLDAHVRRHRLVWRERERERER